MSFQEESIDARDDKESFPFLTEEDTQECATFLLTLKHRSVTPEPFDEEFSSPRFTSLNHQAPLFEPLYLSGNPDHSDDSASQSKTPSLFEENDLESLSVESFLDDAELVSSDDLDLVPDAVVVAMAQMKTCQLTDADRVGCYKNREIGFTGMCCKHCGGQPGFGKYFPATLRSLAQTTTSQTILKHVSSKCRFCPPHVRQTILDLQRQQAIKDTKHAGRPRYGSRKVFFQRIWGRLHDQDIPERPLHKVGDASSTIMSPVQSDLSEEEDGGDIVVPVRHSRKQRFGVLPTKKNLKRKMETSLARSHKRSRHAYLED